MKQKPDKPQLQIVAGFVPPAVKEVIEKIATDEDRSTSRIVRRLLEESPRIKAELRRRRQEQAA